MSYDPHDLSLPVPPRSQPIFFSMPVPADQDSHKVQLRNVGSDEAKQTFSYLWEYCMPSPGALQTLVTICYAVMFSEQSWPQLSSKCLLEMTKEYHSLIIPRCLAQVSALKIRIVNSTEQSLFCTSWHHCQGVVIFGVLFHSYLVKQACQLSCSGYINRTKALGWQYLALWSQVTIYGAVAERGTYFAPAFEVFTKVQMKINKYLQDPLWFFLFL